MSSPAAATHSRDVLIEISATPGAPPSGVVVVNGGSAQSFDGWLALLGLLADVFRPDPETRAPPGGGSEPATGGDSATGDKR